MTVCNLEYKWKKEQPLIRLFQNVVGRLGGFLRLLIRLMIPYFSEGTAITTAPKFRIAYRCKSAFTVAK